MLKSRFAANTVAAVIAAVPTASPTSALDRRLPPLEPPRLRRVALTNYTSLSGSRGGLDWLNALPALEEVIFLEGFVELEDWALAQ